VSKAVDRSTRFMCTLKQLGYITVIYDVMQNEHIRFNPMQLWKLLWVKLV